MAKKYNKDAIIYNLEIPKDPKYLFVARAFLDNVLGMEQISSKDNDEIVLAVNEAIDKIIRKSDDHKDKKVDMKIKISPKKITVTLYYRGMTTVPGTVRAISEEQVILDEVRERIGDYMLQKSADEVVYSSTGKNKKNVKITKYRRKK